MREHDQFDVRLLSNCGYGMLILKTALNNSSRHSSPSIRCLPYLGAHREANLCQPLYHHRSECQQLPTLNTAAHSIPIRLLSHPLRRLDALFPPLDPLPNLISSLPTGPVRIDTSVFKAELCQHGAAGELEYEAFSNIDGDMGIRCPSCGKEFGLGGRGEQCGGIEDLVGLWVWDCCYFGYGWGHK